MLSILIPTYNYNILPLVEELHWQVLEEDIPFEIIVLDDASPDRITVEENRRIAFLEKASYTLLDKNIGRSAIRNLLGQKAKYPWLLFLDADTIPTNKTFIKTYLSLLTNEEKVVYGGIRYQEEKPPAGQLLRWIYGYDREALPVSQRKKLPYRSLLTLNFAIKKSVFNKVTFNESIPNLRHEDTLFSHELEKAGIIVEHIDNPVIHLGLENSEIFLRKTEESVIGLKYLLDKELLSNDYLRIIKASIFIRKFGLRPLVSFFFSRFKKSFQKNLLGVNPSLFVYDLYRLGYICSLK